MGPITAGTRCKIYCISSAVWKLRSWFRIHCRLIPCDVPVLHPSSAVCLSKRFRSTNNWNLPPPCLVRRGWENGTKWTVRSQGVSSFNSAQCQYFVNTAVKLLKTVIKLRICLTGWATVGFSVSRLLCCMEFWDTANKIKKFISFAASQEISDIIGKPKVH